MRKDLIAIMLACSALGACAATPTGLPPVGVVASAETAPVGTANEDAADDPAIWRNAADPAASLIVATDKKAGLYVYDLGGAIKSFIDAGAVNNVDLVELADGTVLVAASDRNDLANSMIAFFTLDTASGELTPIGRASSGAGEAYGICLSTHGGLSVLAVIKDGTLREYAIDEATAATATALSLQRDFSVPTQPEGCAYDERDGTLYVGEEVGGIWRFADGATSGAIVAPIDNQYLVADVEGLALVPEGESGGWLIASSQGDNAYAVFALPGMAPVGRFAIQPGTFGSAEETDGIAQASGDFGPAFPDGLFIAQDGQNEPEAQNFKLVRWDAIKSALGIQ